MKIPYNIFLRFLVPTCRFKDQCAGDKLTTKEVKKIIKGWAFNIKDRTEASIKELEEFLDKDDQVGETNKELIQKRKQLEQLYDLRDDMLRQKSRLNWQKNGDRNSKFYHQVIQKRRKRNAINNLVWCNRRISKPDALKEAFYHHFKDFFEEKESLNLFKLGNLVDRLISEREQAWLEREISMEEIEFSLSLSANEKAPGPDGFNMGCIKFLWQQLKSGNRDSLIWLPLEGSYTAARSYDLLVSERSETKVECNFIWKYKVPPKVQIFLWNYFNKILPTSSFLANRLGQRFIGSRVCKWCNRDEETQMHLFWRCEMAKWAWSFVSSWWNIEKSVSISEYKNKKNELHVLITYRSQLWCQAANLIDDGPTWKTNPIGMILSSSKKRLSSLFNANSDLIGFIDGAWKISEENKIQAGIGGYLKDAKGNLILVFSGPVNASSASECEYRAICFLINKIVSSQWRGKSCVIYSDSVEMVKDIQQSKFKMDHSEFENSKSVILLSKMEFKKVDRVLN
ncbi:hypothetical protein POM88_051138 [Heracleum sosnowskyi]|uniref:Reverse transcriptase zinc-binding domain-containing protein n=1 Tax=Heracleum sosnowskyi TaxID=360622 RepID=A0AAD8H1C4_9APIA|nr:hypothetical protein POM88_051138 [Heracleum sosnowskyi]